ncbi:hypothetical protein TYRP_010663 [Tyrophagus putrescentiae]|nr:hypothetical protein TYRP_010663 [Tyrophagus putrescentiae]
MSELSGEPKPRLRFLFDFSFSASLGIFFFGDLLFTLGFFGFSGSAAGASMRLPASPFRSAVTSSMVAFKSLSTVLSSGTAGAFCAFGLAFFLLRLGFAGVSAAAEGASESRVVDSCVLSSVRSENIDEQFSSGGSSTTAFAFFERFFFGLGCSLTVASSLIALLSAMSIDASIDGCSSPFFDRLFLGFFAFVSAMGVEEAKLGSCWPRLWSSVGLSLGMMPLGGGPYPRLEDIGSDGIIGGIGGKHGPID